MKTSVLFLARNRLAFTREAFTSLRLNTNWGRVDCLTVYDDGSTDGTREWLDTEVRRIPVLVEMRFSSLGSPVAILNDFLRGAEAPFIAKIDNDVLMPPGWLDVALGIFERQPELDCIGLEYWALEGPLPHVGETADSTGGLFLARRVAFAESVPLAGSYGGLQPYQWSQGMRCAWIKPSIPVIPMDRIPEEPYASLSRAYIAKGWQRPWTNYAVEQRPLWNWWLPRAA